MTHAVVFSTPPLFQPRKYIIRRKCEQAELQCKVAQKGIRSLKVLEPEIASVFVPPFVLKEEAQSSTGAQSPYQRVAKRRSFRKKKERPKVESGTGNNADHRETTTEEISVPKDIDLIGLPQLCFPGVVFSGRVNVPALEDRGSDLGRAADAASSV
ncbi:unnamed protein product [Ranitomeya imitator]|uniref:Uncharacterized protein n=1 Tax=Ranitomeya imitator TaxID=111125 RepID=A0ABN9L6T5_9NEOB|nr:unnamed protein product [Ranitomeya imitator]